MSAVRAGSGPRAAALAAGVVLGDVDADLLEFAQEFADALVAGEPGFVVGGLVVAEDAGDGGAFFDDAYRGEFRVLIVWALDRLTRGGAEDALRLIRQFRERGCIIVSIQETWLNGNPEIQDSLVAFAGWMAQQ